MQFCAWMNVWLHLSRPTDVLWHVPKKDVLIQAGYENVSLWDTGIIMYVAYSIIVDWELFCFAVVRHSIWRHWPVPQHPHFWMTSIVPVGIVLHSCLFTTHQKWSCEMCFYLFYIYFFALQYAWYGFTASCLIFCGVLLRVPKYSRLIARGNPLD